MGQERQSLEQALGTGAAAPLRRPAPWWKWVLSVGIAAGLIALLAYGFTRSPKDIPSPLVYRPAPDFTLALLDGGPLSLRELRGKVVVVNFWASWCYPACWNEAPRLEAAWHKYRDQGVVVVGLNYQDREAEARAFIQRFGKTFPNGPDKGSKIAIEYGVYGVPETFFIDHAGRIYAKQIGEISWETLEAKIEEGLARRRPQAGGSGAAMPTAVDGRTKVTPETRRPLIALGLRVAQWSAFLAPLLGLLLFQLFPFKPAVTFYVVIVGLGMVLLKRVELTQLSLDLKETIRRKVDGYYTH